MSQRLWSPAQILLHTSFSTTKSQIQCVGLTKHSKRCRWDISPSFIPLISSLLAQLSSLSPDPDDPAISQLLNKLAPLCLCADFHQHQARSIVARWTECIWEISDISGLQLSGKTVTCSQQSEEEKNGLERALKEERERGQRLIEEMRVLKEEAKKDREGKQKWIDRCDEAEGAKESLLILVNRQGKELAKSGRELEKLEGILKEIEAERHEEKDRREERDAEKVKMVDQLKEKLDEQCRISKQLLDSLEEMRASRTASADEAETMKRQLTTEQQASEQQRQALGDAEGKQQNSLLGPKP